MVSTFDRLTLDRPRHLADATLEDAGLDHAWAIVVQDDDDEDDFDDAEGEGEDDDEEDEEDQEDPPGWSD